MNDLRQGKHREKDYNRMKGKVSKERKRERKKDCDRINETVSKERERLQQNE